MYVVSEVEAVSYTPMLRMYIKIVSLLSPFARYLQVLGKRNWERRLKIRLPLFLQANNRKIVIGEEREGENEAGTENEDKRFG